MVIGYINETRTEVAQYGIPNPGFVEWRWSR